MDDNLFERIKARWSRDGEVLLRSPRHEVNESLDLTDLSHNWSLRKSSELYIAPRKGFGTIDELNRWMEEVGREFNPLDVLLFGYFPACCSDEEGRFYHGRLFFAQKLGTITEEKLKTRRIILVNKDEAAKQKLSLNEEIKREHRSERTFDYVREVEVRVLFSERFMNDYFSEARYSWPNVGTSVNSREGRRINVSYYYDSLMESYGIAPPLAPAKSA